MIDLPEDHARRAANVDALLGPWTGELKCYHRASPNDVRLIRVMTIAEGYAMVRRKGCVPYIAREVDLRSWKPQKPAAKTAQHHHPAADAAPPGSPQDPPSPGPAHS